MSKTTEKPDDWNDAPISPTCEHSTGRDRVCGAPTAWAYPALGSGWMALCHEHGLRHSPHIQHITTLILEGKTLLNPRKQPPSGVFKELDEGLLLAINGGVNKFSALCARLHSAASVIRPNHDASRVIDRRLQAMRKAGRLVYTGAGGWRMP